MKFQRVEIYGFGKWVDTEFNFSNSSFIALYGENESGKSTLQQFILYMLFGLPPRKRNFYKPKNSNRVGGMLTIEDEKNGVYTIERVGDELNCLLSNGKTEDEAWLKEQLKGLTREVYDSIYSFSALDLSAIQQMKASELSDVLFSVGLTGATNIYEVEKQLDTQLGELFKKTGRRPIINEQINKVKDIHFNMMKYKEKENDYRHKKKLQEDLLDELSATEKELIKCQERLIKYEKIEHIMPSIHNYKQLSEKLDALPNELSFPEDGVARYQSLKMNLLPAKSEHAILHKNYLQYEKEISDLKNQMYEKEVYEVAESIVKEKHVYESCLRHIEELKYKRDKTNELLQEQLQQTSMEKVELEDIVLPFHLETTWKEISEMNMELQSEKNRIADDFQVINEEINRLKEERAAIEKQVIPETKLKQINEEIKKYNVYYSEIKKYTDQRNKMSQWESKRTKTAKNTLLTTASIAIILFFIGIFLSNNNLYTISVFFIVAGVAQFIFVKSSINDMHKNTDTKPIEPKINKAGYEKYEQIITEQDRFQTDKMMIDNELKRLNFANLQWEERKRLFTQRENSWFDRVETERYQYPFLTSINPSYWVELLRIIREVKQLIYDKNQYDIQLTELHHNKELFDDKFSVVTKGMNKNNVNSIEEMEHLVEERRSQVQLIDQYKKMKKENLTEQVELDEKIKVFEAEIRFLFNVAEVTDEEAYFKVANELAEKRHLIEEKRKIEQQVTTMFPNDFKEKLLTENMNYNEIEFTIIQLKEQIQSSQSDISAINKQLATVQMEIEQMEISDDISKTAFIYQVEQDKLNVLAKKWAVLKVAQSTLLHAKNAYQEKYLTEVMNKTSTYFSQLTNKEYINVFAPTPTKKFMVEASDYIRYTVDELSQGTIDQLYVSLRLAISKVMSEKFVIPLMIDDAFVHFDENRTNEVIQLIQQIGQEQQILLFTCKLDIAQKVEARHITDNEKVNEIHSL